MNRFSQIILVVLALMYLAPAQAAVNYDSGIGACQVFAEDGKTEEGKKKDGKKKDGTKKEGEEEPECD